MTSIFAGQLMLEADKRNPLFTVYCQETEEEGQPQVQFRAPMPRRLTGDCGLAANVKRGGGGKLRPQIQAVGANEWVAGREGLLGDTNFS